MYVNRAVAIVMLKPPFLDWLSKTGGSQSTSDEIKQTSHVVLLPEETLYDEEMTVEILNRYWMKIASHVFNTWMEDPETWPKNFSLEEFEQFFDLAIIDSPVMDLVLDDELTREE